jgi:delta-aminolevulinic acid dehydratase/porphobilinogen synthase
MPTVPGAFPASLGSLVPIADRTADLGVSGLALFVIPAHEGPYGSLAGGEERVGQTESRWLQEVA